MITELQLADWRRRVSELYAAVRGAPAAAGWKLWRRTREELFLSHPQSPLPEGERDPAHVPLYFDYDPAWRRRAALRPADRTQVRLPGSGSETIAAERFAIAEVEGLPPLSLHWLRDYAGGIFLCFRDGGAGSETYGGGRYLLDTAKGADLGGDGDTVVLDFNFAYQPSCSYDPRWECPLAPPENRVPLRVKAGERYRPR
ncbi:MAG: DUF1684 domain-containing protein [Candidatus Dormibacteraeota bacterium]|nr:DUF1684 domain-containing protein [Candidatus Dormibacteraeota bacterium]